MILVKGDKVIHNTTNTKLEVLEVLEKKILEPQQVKCKVLKSVITEDKGQIFEYDLTNLTKI